MNTDNMVIRKYNKMYLNSITSFLATDDLFPGSNDAILESLTSDTHNTLILLNDTDAETDSVYGFIQGKSTEIVFIAVSNSLRKRGFGRRLYQHYCDCFGNGMPGFYARVETEDAQKFWKKMGFSQQDEFHWSLVFNQKSSSDDFLDSQEVVIEIFTDLDKKIGSTFITQTYVSPKVLKLQNHFIHYIQSQDNLLHISIDGKQLEPKKIKYAQEFGVKVEDSRWAVIAEIPIPVMPEVK